MHLWMDGCINSRVSPPIRFPPNIHIWELYPPRQLPAQGAADGGRGAHQLRAQALPLIDFLKRERGGLGVPCLLLLVLQRGVGAERGDAPVDLPRWLIC